MKIIRKKIQELDNSRWGMERLSGGKELGSDHVDDRRSEPDTDGNTAMKADAPAKAEKTTDKKEKPEVPPMSDKSERMMQQTPALNRNQTIDSGLGRSERQMQARNQRLGTGVYGLKEEIANGVGGGAIAGLGIGSQGEPGVKRGKFAGNTTFKFPTKKYNSFLHQSKSDRKWWQTYMGEECKGELEEVRDFARKNPKAPIIFEDDDTGACFYARYGKK